MPRHRVDINLTGTSHYVDGRLHGASGFPLRDHELPEGLRLGGHQASQDRKRFVKNKGFGVSVEWGNRRDAHGAQGGRDMVGPGPEEGGRRDPGLFNVPEDDEDDEDDEGDEGDARSRAASRREDMGIRNYRGHRGYPGHDIPDRTMSRADRERMHREAGMSRADRERMHREADMSRADYERRHREASMARRGGENAYSMQGPSRRNNFGTGNYHPQTRPLSPVAYPYMRDGNGNITWHPSTRPPYPERLRPARPSPSRYPDPYMIDRRGD